MCGGFNQTCLRQRRERWGENPPHRCAAPSSPVPALSALLSPPPLHQSTDYTQVCSGRERGGAMRNMLRLNSRSAPFRGAFEGHLRPILKAPPDAAHKCSFFSQFFGGRTATILRGLTYPKIVCAPKKEERKRENGDITWCRSSLSWARAAEIVCSEPPSLYSVS